MSVDSDSNRDRQRRKRSPSSKAQAGRCWTYVLKCGDGSLYVGHAFDVRARLVTHATGRGSLYARAHLPVELLGAWEFDSRSEAARAESSFRRLTRLGKLGVLGSPMARLPFASARGWHDGSPVT